MKEEDYKNPNLVRRRFYLSKESLKLIDKESAKAGVSSSVYLDSILMMVVEQLNKTE